MAERSDRPEGREATAAPLLSVVIPVYNEENLISEVLRRVRAVPIRKQIIVVDDGSTDGTVGVIERLRDDPSGEQQLNPAGGSEEPGDVLIVHQAMINMGKGTAIRIGLRHAVGDIVLIQDADMEYDPDDYPALLAPIQRGEADVVYGVRFHRPIKGMLRRHRIANWVFAAIATVLYGRLIRDEATAYKVFRREVIMSSGPARLAVRVLPGGHGENLQAWLPARASAHLLHTADLRRREEDRLARRSPHALDALPLPLLRLTEPRARRSVARLPLRDVYSEPSPHTAGNKEWATWQQRPLT